MLSKNQQKLITSLQQKKYRNKYGLFIAEGGKATNEFLNAGFEVEFLFCTEDYLDCTHREDAIVLTENELKKISSLKTPNKVLGVFKIPKQESFINEGLIVALDGVNDPGNLGTIIRLCDWFGVRQIICSPDTVDCYNSKVIQATMGSLSRVSIFYRDLTTCLKTTALPIYGAVMNGENVYTSKLKDEGILLLGNEANGISKEIESFITHKITIPRFGDLQQTESLNVATATAILLNEFRRSHFTQR